LAQHSNLASTDVTGVHQGVFMIYEPIDKVFIEKYVDEKDQGGDLYKAGWTWNGADLTNKSSVGIEDEDVPQVDNAPVAGEDENQNQDDAPEVDIDDEDVPLGVIEDDDDVLDIEDNIARLDGKVDDAKAQSNSLGNGTEAYGANF
jgi:hypothetical protein